MALEYVIRGVEVCACILACASAVEGCDANVSYNLLGGRGIHFGLDIRGGLVHLMGRSVV